MSTRLEVQSAIEQLPKDEIRHLAKWLQEYLDDRQTESDVQRSHGSIGYWWDRSPNKSKVEVHISAKLEWQ
jgi:predicted RecA/RadA family phage recombinase